MLSHLMTRLMSENDANELKKITQAIIILLNNNKFDNVTIYDLM